MTDKIYDALILGAGFAGIGAAIKLQNMGIINFKVIEKDSSIGGTWQGNTYPGAACDVPSHFYCYSFNPNPNWSRKFAPQKEILQYINDTADKFDVRKYVQLDTTVKSFVLNETKGIWAINLESGKTLYARHILNGMGGLHMTSVPAFNGLDKFAGPTMHSARWDHDVDFKGKRVAVIGSAASAIQIIPELAKICEQVNIYQRTPNYIAPRMDRAFTDKEQQRFSKWPWFSRLYRWWIYKRMDVFVYPLTRQGSKAAPKAMSRLAAWVRSVISDKKLQDRMIPDYTIGCKRILLSDTFYYTLERQNVEVISSGISEIVNDGIHTGDGETRRADIIVFATGFDISGHMHSIEVVGIDGVSLRDLGLDGELSFKGAMHSQFPNYYTITGANTGVGTSSVVYMIELQLDYILKLMKAAGPDNMIAVKQDVLAQYNSDMQEKLSESVWASGCDSWYIREDGKIVTLYPGNAKAFAKEHKRVDLKNYNVVPMRKTAQE